MRGVCRRAWFYVSVNLDVGRHTYSGSPLIDVMISSSVDSAGFANCSCVTEIATVQVHMLRFQDRQDDVVSCQGKLTDVESGRIGNAGA
jgi:hypothetical protein